jgi:hypothetical protein
MNNPEKTRLFVAAIGSAALSAIVTASMLTPSYAQPVTATEQQAALTALLRHVTVDDAGNVTIQGSVINIKGDSSVLIKSSGTATLQGALTIVKGGTVTIN